MVAFTTAKQLVQVANSSFVGTWDVPTNSNWGVVDASLGQIAFVTLNNSPVTLSASQFQCSWITFVSTLTGNVAVTFPSSFTGMYVIQNRCTGSSAFVVTLKTTVAGANQIGCKPYDLFDIFNDGTSISYRNMGHIGSYWDYAGSSTPAWITACTVQPYLVCDGTTFSSAVYPALATILNGTTLPDARGRARFSVNNGTARITSSVSGVDGNTLLANGGNENLTSHTHGYLDLGHSHLTGSFSANISAGPNAIRMVNAANPVATDGSLIGITIQNTGNGASQNMPPAYVGGITMIRSA